VPVKVWDDGLDSIGAGTVIAAFRASVRERLARWCDPAARAYGPETDASHRAATQLGPVNADTHGRHGDPVMFHGDSVGVYVPCSGGCGRSLIAYGSWQAIDWSCGTCHARVSPPRTLRLLGGGRDAGHSGGVRPSDIGDGCG